MCGIAGVYDPSGQALFDLEKMGNALVHRGPDASGQWVSKGAGIGLVHRRLSILDRSSAGSQPMQSAQGRYVIVFNGEIYNHMELRRLLELSGEGVQWRGSSDTETLLACIVAWGLARTLEMTVGMFAFALWDQERRQLSLARDRMGEKPLYYGFVNNRFWFASELKALRANSLFVAVINSEVLPLFLRHDAVPVPYSIYKGISKLRPGCYVVFDQDDLSSKSNTEENVYWSVLDYIDAPRLAISEEEAVNKLDELLRDAVRGQLMSDVPLGAFLSGGIDSSTIVALMQEQSSRKVRTFSIGTDDPVANEALYAKSVAEHLGSEHAELYVKPEDALDIIPSLPKIYCEPFADISQIPSLLVSRLAKQHVTVALTGDGGDELFGGYNRYIAAENIWKRVRDLPFSMRKMINLAGSFPQNRWDQINKIVGHVLPTSLQVVNLGAKMGKLFPALSAVDDVDFYRKVVSRWAAPESVVTNFVALPSLLDCRDMHPKTTDLLDWMMAMDAKSYLHDDVLTKVDRAGMAYGLETRAPFLDHRVVEFAFRLPSSIKVNKGVSKWPLRAVLDRYVPDHLVNRPKAGFGLPMDKWLRGGLRPWAEELLDVNRMRQQGYLQYDVIRELWIDHQSGKTDASSRLWGILMFQAWLADEV